MEYLERDWKELEVELTKFQTNHKEYVKKLEEVENMKKTYAQQFQRLKKKLKLLNGSVSKIEKDDNKDGVNKETLQDIKGKVGQNLDYMQHISHTFPRPNGLYLKIILGNISMSILNKDEKWNYKEEYERFKFVITIITMCFSFLLIFVQNYRTLDSVFNFLLVWYYCTLTIRESILVVNGSGIKGWWQAHHFISTVCMAILILCPDLDTDFRQNFIYFSFYLSMVQLMQYYYQKGSLYRLRALGLKEDMDTTVEGFQSWMLRGLSFLLPFLFFGYFWELYNSYLLFTLIRSGHTEWQVYALCGIFFVLFLGNFLTTYVVIREKFAHRLYSSRWLKFKYKDIKKLTQLAPFGDKNAANNTSQTNEKDAELHTD